MLAIVNPRSGGGAAHRARPHVEAFLRKHGVEAQFCETTSIENVKALARDAADTGKIVGVVGGDGTIHHAVNAAWDLNPRFAIFPAGNGNDIARGLGIPLDPVAAAAQFVKGTEHAVDLPRVRAADGSRHVFLAAGGAGLDGLTAHLVNGRFKGLKGVARYVAAALWSLRAFRPFEVQVELDGQGAFRFGPTLIAAATNGPVYGSGVCMSPTARMDDGLLDLVLVPQLPLLRVLEALPIVLTTGDLRWPELRRERARRVVLRPVDATEPLLFQADGEVLGKAPVEIEVQPGALRMIF